MYDKNNTTCQKYIIIVRSALLDFWSNINILGISTIHDMIIYVQISKNILQFYSILFCATCAVYKNGIKKNIDVYILYINDNVSCLVE